MDLPTRSGPITKEQLAEFRALGRTKPAPALQAVRAARELPPAPPAARITSKPEDSAPPSRRRS